MHTAKAVSGLFSYTGLSCFSTGYILIDRDWRCFMPRFLAMLGLIIMLSACSALESTSSEAKPTSAVVTGVSNGRASVPSEKMYGLRTASGRVYFVTQSLKKPLKEGETAELEIGNNGQARIRER
jgi:hypothetical protein